MNRNSNDRLEETLRSSAGDARRDPPRELRARIVARLESRERSASANPASRSSARRARAEDVLAAAAIVIAIGVWSFAFLRPLPSGAPTSSSEAAHTDSTLEDGLGAAVGGQASASVIAAALATPRTLRTAIDESLFAELGNIAHDATRAAHFLVGRVPAPLVTHAPDDAAR